jgi:hypothetical protein
MTQKNTHGATQSRRLQLMNNNAHASGDANPSGEPGEPGEPGVPGVPGVPGDRTAPAQSPRDAGGDLPSLSNDTPRVVDDPPPTSRADIARQRRALRRAYHNTTAPSWVKKIPRFLFPVYGVMRMHDPNYEEHFGQWQEQQRRTYDEGESQ